jgi:hypothetical protein
MINKRIERMILGLFLGPQCDFIGTTAAMIAGSLAAAGSSAPQLSRHTLLVKRRILKPTLLPLPPISNTKTRNRL